MKRLQVYHIHNKHKTKCVNKQRRLMQSDWVIQEHCQWYVNTKHTRQTDAFIGFHKKSSQKLTAELHCLSGSD